MAAYGRDWREIAAMVRTRSVVQTRTHAQKFFQKMQKAADQASAGGSANSVVSSNLQIPQASDIKRKAKPKAKPKPKPKRMPKPKPKPKPKAKPKPKPRRLTKAEMEAAQTVAAATLAVDIAASHARAHSKRLATGDVLRGTWVATSASEQASTGADGERGVLIDVNEPSKAWQPRSRQHLLCPPIAVDAAGNTGQGNKADSEAEVDASEGAGTRAVAVAEQNQEQEQKLELEQKLENRAREQVQKQK